MAMEISRSNVGHHLLYGTNDRVRQGAIKSQPRGWKWFFKVLTKKAAQPEPGQVALHVLFLLKEAVFKVLSELFGLLKAGILVDHFQVVV